MGRLYNQARRRREPAPVEPWEDACPICSAPAITQATAKDHLATHGLMICRGPRELSRRDFDALVELHDVVRARREASS